MRRKIGVMVWLAGLMMVLGGCGTGVVRDGDAQLSAESDAAFLDRLASAETVDEHDAMRGMILLIDGQDSFTTFADRVEHLRQAGIVPAEWDMGASAPLTRGRLAYMTYVATEMSGGVVLTVTGPSQRYCLRELQYQGVIGEGAIFTKISGMEFVGVLGQADIYRRTGQFPDKAGRIDDN
jgi:hypothetical protein